MPGFPRSLGRNTVTSALWLTVGVFVCAVIGIELTRESGRIASIWLANAVVLVVILKSPRRNWPGWLLCSLAGNLAADLFTGDATWLAVVLSICNLAEITVAAWLFRWREPGVQLDLTRMKSLFLFIGVAGIAGPVTSGCLAALTMHLHLGLPFWSVFRTWSSADALGLLLLVPLFGGIPQGEFIGVLKSRARTEAIVIIVLAPILTVAIIGGGHFAWFFLLSPLFLWAVFRFGLAGVASGIFIVTASGLAALAMGSQVGHTRSLREEIEFLQIFLVTNILIFLPVASLLRSQKESEDKFSSSFRNGPLPMTISEIETGCYLDVNDAWQPFSGFSRNELIGRTSTDLGILTFDDREKMKTLLLETGRVKDQLLLIHAKDGQTRTCLLSAEIISMGGKPRLLATCQDITKLKEQSRHLERLTEMYAALSQVNQAIVWSPTREALLEKICEVMVEFGKFSMAWIGWNDPTSNEVKVLHQYGDRFAYLENLHVRSDDSPLGRGATGTAIRTGTPSVINDFLGSQESSPWHTEAANSGFAASASFPIQLEGKVVGALTVYAPEKDFFGSHEIALLEEAAGDITFALDHLEMNARRMTSEAEVQRLANLLRESQKIGKVGGWEIDLVHNTLFWTEETYRIHDLTPQEYTPTLETAIEFYAPESLPVIQDAVQAAITENKPFDLELQMLTSKMRKIWVHTTCHPIQEEGKTVRVVGAFRDISEQKWEKQQLLESESRFRNLIETAPIAILLTRNGLCLYGNSKSLELLGHSSMEELIGRSFLDVFAQQSRKESIERSRRRSLGLPVTNSFEATGLRKDGSQFPFFAVVSSVTLSDGPANVAFVTDLTELRQAEEQQQTLHAQLEQSQKMESLGILAGGVAHDMNNVLGAILSLASAHLAVQPKDNPVYPALETIRDAAVRGGDMVKALLHFARQTPSSKQRLDLNALLLEEARLLERTTLSKVRLEMDLAPDLHFIHGDGSSLTHAFMNLCVNAVDAMGEGGTLTLQTRNIDGGMVEVVVQDTGFGMTKEVLARALDPFFTTKDVGKGTGLGLSMVYKTVTAHNGHLEIESEPGKGTTVRMLFPVTVTEDLGPEEDIQDQPGDAKVALSVLLVDDDDLILKSTKMLVEVLGHSVTPTASGEEALALLEQGFQPDAVILDMNMPGYGGKGTLPRLRVLCPEVPVLLATGRADQDALDLIAAHPHVKLLPKPFSIEELRGHLSTLGHG